MKIVATITANGYGDDKFLVEATSDELLRLMGHTHHRHNGAPAGFKVGDQINVIELYKRLTNIRAAESQLSDAAKSLEAAATIARNQGPFFTSLTAEPPDEDRPF